MFMLDWWKRKKLRKNLGITIGMQINFCKDCNKISKVADIQGMFDWSNGGIKAIGYDKESNEILLAEEQIMRIIQMVNPAQKLRKIRLVKQDELWASGKVMHRDSS
ncbi:MAG: hypothetical protein ACOY46_19835 [Bacillota bacterium]